MKTTLLALALLMTVPAACAQEARVEGYAYTTLPHSLELPVGNHTIQSRVVAEIQCENGLRPPRPVQVAITPSTGPNDGRGPAWSFPVRTWSVDWTAGVNGTYAINHPLAIQVEVFGHGNRGYDGELTLQTNGQEGPDCTAAGYFMRPSGEHGHFSVPARPGGAQGSGSQGSGSPSAGAAGPEALLVLACLMGVALRRRW